MGTMNSTNGNGVAAAATIESLPIVHDDSLTISQSYMESKEVCETKEIAAELCRHFYTLGWLLGTGGSITIKVHDVSIPRQHQIIVMSPSGVEKERMVAEDMYVLSSDGFMVSSPPSKPYPYKPSKCTDCAPLFLKAYEIRNAGAVIHSHGMEACLVTMINPFAKEFRITHMEMIKGIQGHGYHDELVVPVIENTAHERELTESFTQAIRAYPKSTAVLVRNHGVFIWGDSWISAKTQAECYHYLFDAAIKLHQLGLDCSSPSHGPLRLRRINELWGSSGNLCREPKRFLLLSIEGTVIPMSFFGKYVITTYETEETQHGHVWRNGFQSNELVGDVFEDVPEALERWHTSGIKVYAYSSDRREVQQLLLANSSHGDLRKYLCGFFDTTIGNNRVAHSYSEILKTVGVGRPSDLLFITHSFQEAVEARAAGLEVIISIRPGNGALPENHGFKTTASLLEI